MILLFSLTLNTKDYRKIIIIQCLFIQLLVITVVYISEPIAIHKINNAQYKLTCGSKYDLKQINHMEYITLYNLHKHESRNRRLAHKAFLIPFDVK